MSRKVKVNMTGVESYTKCPEGEWLARLKKIELGEVQGSGEDALKAQFEVIKGKAKGNTVFETFSLSEKALWKLKSCLDALGMKCDGKLTLDLDKMEGKICMIEVIHDEYNGSKRAKISSYAKPDADEDEDEEDETDEELDEEEDEDDEDEKPVKKSSKKSAPAKSKKKPEPEDDDDEDDDEDEEEDDEDEEEEPPKKSKKSSKSEKKSAPTKKKSKKDDEDDDWEEDD